MYVILKFARKHHQKAILWSQKKLKFNMKACLVTIIESIRLMSERHAHSPKIKYLEIKQHNERNSLTNREALRITGK